MEYQVQAIYLFLIYIIVNISVKAHTTNHDTNKNHEPNTSINPSVSQETSELHHIHATTEALPITGIENENHNGKNVEKELFSTLSYENVTARNHTNNLKVNNTNISNINVITTISTPTSTRKQDNILPTTNKSEENATFSETIFRPADRETKLFTLSEEVTTNFEAINVKPTQVTSTPKLIETDSLVSVTKNTEFFSSDGGTTTSLPFEEFTVDIPPAMASAMKNTSSSEQFNASIPKTGETVAKHNESTSIDENKSDTENKLPTLRKCCEISMYYSVTTHSCVPTKSNSYFDSNILSLVDSDEPITFHYTTALLKSCPGTNQPPSTSDITNDTHLILDSGEVMEKSTQYLFKKTEYCLELVGSEIENARLTLVFCYHFSDPGMDVYDYLSETDTGLEDKQLVRKCCGKDEYYSTQFNQCTSNENIDIFLPIVKDLTFKNNDVNFEIISGLIPECPDKSRTPEITSIDTNAYRLLYSGELIEVATGIRHNYSHYCLEMVGAELNRLSLTLVLCYKAYILPKCCQSGMYFDEIELDCLPFLPSHDQESDMISKFQLREADLQDYLLKPIDHSMSCQSTFPTQEEAKNLFISKGKLCNYLACFEKNDFCIDFIGHRNKKLVASAFYCQKEYFIKCCNESQILSEEGCIANNEGNSALIQQLLNTRAHVNKFDSKGCRKEKTRTLDEAMSSHLRWWVSNDGSYITLESADFTKNTVHNYCVDDFTEDNGKVGPIALVCDSDVNHLLPSQYLFTDHSKNGSLGKCCEENWYDGHVFFYSNETNTCQPMAFNHSLKENEFLKTGSFREEHYHGFPGCPEGVGYHIFLFKPGPEDYAVMSPNGSLTILSKTGKCIQSESVVNDRDFCIEYVISEGELTAAAFLCAQSLESDVFTEKFSLVTSLMGISCAFLFLTLIYLFTLKVRRGLSSVKKVNTLAGRILVSFVGSHLLGFLSLSLTQHENSLNRQNSPGCYVLAGFVQFFNLATFCWNTSICLESLLLTMDISVSKCVRYLCHSIWAWGFPATMTMIMFIMDVYQDTLPCWVVTPKIGVLHCFHSDRDAKLLYFYVPILITLIGNIVFLISGKALRRARLKRLEKGGPKKPNTGEPGAERAASHSGMRIHQIKNVKGESLRIVIWTGGTWFIELIGFVSSSYIFVPSSGKWYEYFWYIPTCFNALRGVGIFMIIVLTPQKRKEMKKNFITVKNRVRTIYQNTSTINRKNLQVPKQSMHKSSDSKTRNMSVTTMISVLSSSFYSSNANNTDNESKRKTSFGSIISSKLQSYRKTSSTLKRGESATRVDSGNISISGQRNAKPTRKTGMIRSVSQIYAGLEEMEMEEEYRIRKCSIPLPKLQEEESVFDREELMKNPTLMEEDLQSDVIQIHENGTESEDNKWKANGEKNNLEENKNFTHEQIIAKNESITNTNGEEDELDSSKIRTHEEAKGNDGSLTSMNGKEDGLDYHKTCIQEQIEGNNKSKTSVNREEDGSEDDKIHIHENVKKNESSSSGIDENEISNSGEVLQKNDCKTIDGEICSSVIMQDHENESSEQIDKKSDDDEETKMKPSKSKDSETSQQISQLSLDPKGFENEGFIGDNGVITSIKSRP